MHLNQLCRRGIVLKFKRVGVVVGLRKSKTTTTVADRSIVFLLLSFYWSRKPADEFHLFGHGRAQNVAAMISATILIFFMSLEAFREAVQKLFQTTETSARPLQSILPVLFGYHYFCCLYDRFHNVPYFNI